MRKKIVSIIGPNTENATPEMLDFAVRLGKCLTDKGFRIVCGGREGIMEAVCRGAHSSDAYTCGATIGILPGTDRNQANPWCDIVIPTGIGLARNMIVANTGDVVVALAGGAGTLSEMAYAWQLNRPLVAFTAFGGAAALLAGRTLDNRRTDHIHQADTLEELLQMVCKLASAPDSHNEHGCRCSEK